ncbi:MAG: 4-(cytidine 5'-diphospho)-2-C-methyl-D-erythritol kinase [bacterium JZ-2024 1]
MGHLHRRLIARAKLNLYLSIGKAGENGLHPIESVFQSVSLSDTMDFFVVGREGFRIEIVEGAIPGGETLVRRVLEALSEVGRTSRGMAVVLHKRIPVGAGLGGGSADAGATLVAGNDLWELGLSVDQLLNMSRSIGSDIGFFLFGGTCVVTGTGEVIRQIDPLPSYPAVVCYPGFPARSEEAYRWWDAQPVALEMSLSDALDRLRAGESPAGYTNAFEPILTHRFPVIRQILERMREEGAFWWGVSGSGSAVYGLFKDTGQALDAYRHLASLDTAEVYRLVFERRAIVEGEA